MLAEKAIAEVMDKEGEEQKASQAALLAMTPTGAIRAMVGGRNYGKSQYNRATQALRQPGSSFKLFVYLAGLEAGLTPDSLVEDEPISFKVPGGTWTPKNYTGRYLGAIPLREAVAQSVNTAAVRVADWAGLHHVIDVARRLGISTPIDEVPSIALGSTEVSLLELTAAFAHLPAGGASVTPYGIVAIEKEDGEILYRRQPPAGGIVLSGHVVGRMNELLLGVVSSGTGRGAAIGRPAAGKTGTTSDYRDAWFMGYTPDLACGVWVGNDDNSPMKKVTGGGLPARIWRGFMREALANTPAHGIPTGGLAPPLPWQTDRSLSTPLSGPRRDVELGPSFWDKLFGAPPARR
jgi:penicillin-binding protein 1A